MKTNFSIETWRCFWVSKNTLPFARGPYDCLLGGEAYTAGCMSILRALFCSFSSKPLSKHWSEEFYYNFLNKLSCVPLSYLFHICTVQPQNTCYQDLVPANNLTLWVLPSSTTPRLWRRPWYVNTQGYLNYRYNIFSRSKQNKQTPNKCVCPWSSCLSFLPSLWLCIWMWQLMHCSLHFGSLLN